MFSKHSPKPTSPVPLALFEWQTTMGRFRSSGYEAAATEAKKQSMSTCKMQRSVVYNIWEGLIKGEEIKLVHPRDVFRWTVPWTEASLTFPGSLYLTGQPHLADAACHCPPIGALDRRAFCWHPQLTHSAGRTEARRSLVPDQHHLPLTASLQSLTSRYL